MPSWIELESKFKELASIFQFSRLDIQWGDSGEHFRIAGTADRLSIERFKILAQIAGNSLFSQDHLEILNESDSLIRWYKALWKIGDNLKIGFMGNMMNDKNEVVGNIYTGTINHFIEASAVLCLRLSSIEEKEVNEAPRERPPHSLESLHPRVIRISNALYTDGHFRAAVLDTYIDLVNRVKQISGRSDLDGSPLMQQVFSPKNPQLILSDDSDEQLGFMWLFSGAVMAIRNAKAHKITEITDPQRTLEWLSFASVLQRVLDDVENVSNS